MASVFGINFASTVQASAPPISLTTTNGSTVCPAAPLSGTWTANTCSISGRLLITPGTTLDIGPGVTLAASSNAAGVDGIDNFGFITNYGIMTGVGSGNNSAGIENGGTIISYGNITGTSVYYGIYNAQTIDSCGTMTGTSTAGGYGISNLDGTINNCGIMTGTSGTLAGISNTATINNYGTMTGVADGSDSGVGIDTIGGHAINNYGTMTGTGGSSSHGIDNHGVVNNYCDATWSSSPSSVGGYAIPPNTCSGSAVLTASICVPPGTMFYCDVTSTRAGVQIYDNASLSVNGFPPTGYIVYEFYSDSACSGPQNSVEWILFSGGSVPRSQTTGPLSAGSYSFFATYYSTSGYPTDFTCTAVTLASTTTSSSSSTMSSTTSSATTSSPTSAISSETTASPTTTSTTCVTTTTSSSSVSVSSSSSASSSATTSTSSTICVSTSTSSSSSSTGSGGVPEFPYELTAASVFTALIIGVYLLVRRQAPLGGHR